MEIKILRFNEETKDPHRQHYNDAGADIYCPKDILVKPGETAVIPLGFGIEIPDGFMGVIFPRSSMAAEGLIVGMPPIDAGYRGEIYAIITNLSGVPVSAVKGTRIGQIVILPIVYAKFVEEHGYERGSGGFGSTGK